MDEVVMDPMSELVGLLRDRRPVVALAGAGLAASAGLPTWRALIEGMFSLGDGQGVHNRSTAFSPALWSDLPWMAQIAVDRAGSAARGMLAERLLLPRDVAVPAPVEIVVGLPFRHFLTTNYDNLLDLAADRGGVAPDRIVRWEEQEARGRFLGALGRSDLPPHFVHLHGRADAPQHCVLTDDDYLHRYVLDPSTARNLYALFATHHVVLLGYSLGDVELQSILREVAAFLGARDGRHFAFVPDVDGEGSSAAVRLRHKFGVSAITYPARRTSEGGVDHVGFLDRLRELDDRVRRSGEEWWAVAAPVEDPDDPASHRFGGARARRGLRLGVVINEVLVNDFVDVTVFVEREDGRPLDTPVAFHLHPTFPDPIRRVSPIGPRAELRLIAWGAFTVGVVVRDPRTLLELAMAPEDGFPRAFLGR